MLSDEAGEPSLRAPPAPQLDGHERHAQLGGDSLGGLALG
jgi:hypothetical protein